MPSGIRQLDPLLVQAAVDDSLCSLPNEFIANSPLRQCISRDSLGQQGIHFIGAALPTSRLVLQKRTYSGIMENARAMVSCQGFKAWLCTLPGVEYRDGTQPPSTSVSLL